MIRNTSSPPTSKAHITERHCFWTKSLSRNLGDSQHPNTECPQGHVKLRCFPSRPTQDDDTTQHPNSGLHKPPDFLRSKLKLSKSHYQTDVFGTRHEPQHPFSLGVPRTLRPALSP